MRDIKTYWRILRHYRGILSHIQTYSELCVTLPYTTVPYSEPWHIKNLRHLQKPVEHVRWSCIFRTLAYSEQFIRVFSRIFRDTQDTDTYSATLTGEQLGPLPFLKPKKVSWFCPSLGYIFHSKCSFKGYLRYKTIFCNKVALDV